MQHLPPSLGASDAAPATGARRAPGGKAATSPPPPPLMIRSIFDLDHTFLPQCRMLLEDIEANATQLSSHSVLASSDAQHQQPHSTTSTGTSHVPSLDGLTCIVCHVVFSNVTEQREHFRSYWHRFNLKVGLALVPSLTLTCLVLTTCCNSQ
jgi:hypothetical protein